MSTELINRFNEIEVALFNKNPQAAQTWLIRTKGSYLPIMCIIEYIDSNMALVLPKDPVSYSIANIEFIERIK